MANEFGNYCTLNPLAPVTQTGSVTLSQGNRKVVGPSSAFWGVPSTMALPSSGKFYVEAKINGGGTGSKGGGLYVITPGTELDVVHYTVSGTAQEAVWGWHFQNNRHLVENGADTSVAVANSDGDIAQMAIDLDNNKVYMGINNTWYSAVNTTTNAPDNSGTQTFSLDASGKHIAANGYSNSGSVKMNFGATAFAHTPPSGYLPLNTANLPTPAVINPDDHYYNVLLDHDGSSTGTTCTFNLDTYEWLAIIKSTSSGNWFWVNSLRGSNKYMHYNLSNSSGREQTSTNVMTVSGTTLTLGSDLADENYLIEVHKAGLASATAANNAGDINTTATSVNTTSGFGISVFTGNATDDQSYGHGLGVIPEFLISKSTTTDNSAIVYHVNSDATPDEHFLKLDANDASADNSVYWSDEAFTSTLVTLGNNAAVNGSTVMVHVYWAGVLGYSQFAQYETNASANGPFLTTNFTPSSVFIKHIDEGGSWYQLYKAQNDGNPQDLYYSWDLDTAQPSAFTFFDWVSSGVKFRTAGGSVNDDGGTVIYGAWGGRSMTSGGINQGRAK